jgi:hypothetical protein
MTYGIGALVALAGAGAYWYFVWYLGSRGWDRLTKIGPLTPTRVRPGRWIGLGSTFL